jgi:hypothetical protein
VPAPRLPPRAIAKGRLSSVATSVRLLKAFSEEQVEIGISDLAKRLGVAKSTVHRLAVTLVDGMLSRTLTPRNTASAWRCSGWARPSAGA